MKGRPTLVVALLVVLGCAEQPDGTRQSRGGEGATERVTVFAASSLTDVFRELGTRFEESNPGVEVAFVFAGSQLLRIQVVEGAPADVFASANPEHVRMLVDADIASGARPFATNRLVVVVPPDNPAGLERFSDLPRATRIVIGSANVPAGRYARDVLLAADAEFGPGFSSSVLANVVSEETNVRLARSRVEVGAADAAIVYETDALRSSRVRIVPIPDVVGVQASYTVARIDREGGAPAAQRWIDFLVSDDGRDVLLAHGFGTPGPS